MFILIRLLKTYIKNPLILFLFHPPTCLETTMSSTLRARIFTRRRLIFLKLPKIGNPFAKLLEEYF
jgi:hypothetical protein